MKTAETNPVYQSQILPIIQKAETEIKTLVLVAFLYAQPKAALLGSILAVINRVKKEIPAEFGDTSAYVNGLIHSADKMVAIGYIKPQNAYFAARTQLLSTAPKSVVVNNPKQLLDITKSKDLWAEAKGSPNVVNYPKELKKTINDLGGQPMMTYETGKKPITVWQKAELDTRYEHQMQMLQDLRVKGVDLCWISSHANCSKRCQKWQGKLVSLSEPSKYSGFRVKKVDGHWVYSLTEIMAQTDKYGYHNNIINGFNCRHRLIPYTGQSAPTKYSDEDIAKQRNIEIHIREMERKIRLYKTQERLYNKSGDKITAGQYKALWKKLESYYKRFCEVHGYAWQEYRIKI